MPATDFGWAVSHNSPVFQVYGTKRKMVVTSNDATEDTVSEHINPAKRKCPDNGGDDGMNDVMEINHNSIFTSHNTTPSTQSNTQNLWQSPPVQQNPAPSLSPQSVPAEIPAAQNHSKPHVYSANTDRMSQTGLGYQQDEMIMDLEDEMYTTAQMVPDSEVEEACSTMESDGAPDPQQYGLVYCDQFCVGGDTSPRSGRVRCYCKPSWEGLMDMRPYVSDYY